MKSLCSLFACRYGSRTAEQSGGGRRKPIRWPWLSWWTVEACLSTLATMQPWQQLPTTWTQCRQLPPLPPHPGASHPPTLSSWLPNQQSHHPERRSWPSSPTLALSCTTPPATVPRRPRFTGCTATRSLHRGTHPTSLSSPAQQAQSPSPRHLPSPQPILSVPLRLSQPSPLHGKCLQHPESHRIPLQ